MKVELSLRLTEIMAEHRRNTLGIPHDKVEQGHWHEVYFDPLINQKIGTLGAMRHILDKNDKPISKGYHSFYMHEGTLFGKVGAHGERVIYDQPEPLPPEIEE